MKAAAQAGIATEVARIADEVSLDRALRSMQERADAAWIGPLPSSLGPKVVAASAMRHRIATHAMSPNAVRDGLLFCHWLEQSDPAQRTAIVVDKILRGANPATIPFELPDKTVLVINRATAAAIGVQVPPDMKLRATEIVGE